MLELLKIPYLRFRYRYFPNSAQNFWAQELLNTQGLNAKLGQIFAQGKSYQIPPPTMSVNRIKKLFLKDFNREINPSNMTLVASMGQVNQFSLDGSDFALKVLHPGIKKKIRKEIDHLILLGQFYSKLKGFSFDQKVYKRFLVEVFEEETNLLREAHFQEEFGKLHKDQTHFKIPKVIKEYSNENFLCQEWVQSTLAQNISRVGNFYIFDFFFNSLFQGGLLHGDLNDRNWGVTSGGKIVIFDYGCSQLISGRRMSGLKKLLLNQDITNGFREFGVRLEASWFKGKEQELRDALFIPLFEKVITPNWSFSHELQEKYQDRIKELREYTDPRVLLFMRSLFSLIRLYQSKGESIPMNKILSPHLELFKLSEKKPMKASEIKIEVTENGKQVVFMTLPITALENIKDLMPERVLEKIIEDQIDLSALIERVKSTDYKPQELFHLKSLPRNYRVWID